MAKEHHYSISLNWVGNLGHGTRGYTDYNRNHVIAAAGLDPIEGSADPSFRGDPSRWNPEQLFLASISACHKLWYLHLAADAGVVVTAYRDNPLGIMAENKDGSGEFTSVTLNPEVMISAQSDAKTARDLHHRVGGLCFIARSVSCPIGHEVTILKEKA